MPPGTLAAGCSRSPRRWTSSTRSGTSTATSSRPTSSSTGTTTRSWAISASSRPWRATRAQTGGAALTAPGFLLGTPNYVAPEIVMGRPFDGRVDQYALAMTVHEVLCGRNCMEGPTPSATVVNQTMVVPPALEELIPGMPRRLSDAVLRGLAKDPDGRFESCTAMAREVLALAAGRCGFHRRRPRGSDVDIAGRAGPRALSGFGAAMPVGREHAGGRIRCMGCQALLGRQPAVVEYGATEARRARRLRRQPARQSDRRRSTSSAPPTTRPSRTVGIDRAVERPATAPREQQRVRSSSEGRRPCWRAAPWPSS